LVLGFFPKYHRSIRSHRSKKTPKNQTGPIKTVVPGPKKNQTDAKYSVRCRPLASTGNNSKAKLRVCHGLGGRTFKEEEDVFNDTIEGPRAPAEMNLQSAFECENAWSGRAGARNQIRKERFSAPKRLKRQNLRDRLSVAGSVFKGISDKEILKEIGPPTPSPPPPIVCSPSPPPPSFTQCSRQKIDGS